MPHTNDILALRPEEQPRLLIGDGCYRRDLPSASGIRVWVVEMDPGSEWPHVDDHPTGEDYYVLEGEVIEGERRYASGTYVHFARGSSHQPRTESGVRLLGINVVAA